MNPLHDASQEIAALQKCQGHENVVEVVENLEDNNYKYIVFELLNGGELFQRISQFNHFTELLARSYFRQLVNAVEFIHNQNIVHRDLKPENIMFVDNKEDSLLKVVDFGFARRRTSEETPPCFTLDYAAPESLTKGTTKESRDMWSLGVILYIMLCGNTPFTAKDIDKRDEKNYRLKVTENIKRGEFNTECLQWERLTREAKTLIASLLQVDETVRLTLKEVLDHPWMTSEPDEVETDKEEDNEDQEPIIVEDDDDMVIPMTVENKSREENCSNDSSGIVVSERNGGSSLSSHEYILQTLPEIVAELTVEDKAETQIEPSVLPITETDETSQELPQLEVPEMPEKKTRGRKRKKAAIQVKQEKQHHEPLSVIQNNLKDLSQMKKVNDKKLYHVKEPTSFKGFQGFALPCDSSLLLSLDHWRQIFIANEHSEAPSQRGLRPRRKNIVYNESKLPKLPLKAPPTSVFFDETIFTITEVHEMPTKRGRPRKNVQEAKAIFAVKVEAAEKPVIRGRKRKAENVAPEIEKKPRKQRRLEVDQIQVEHKSLFENRYPRRQRNQVLIKPEPVQKQSVITHAYTPPKKPRKIAIKKEKNAKSAIETIYEHSTVQQTDANHTCRSQNYERPSMIQERRYYL